MANVVDRDYAPVEGIHVLDEYTYRKQVRSSEALRCETCSKRAESTEAGKLKRCEGCWTVAYCSQECQALARPSHKDHCGEVKKILGLEDIVSDYYQNPFLLHYLRVALIHKLGLLNRNSAARECHLVILHLSFIPVNEKDMVEIGLALRDDADPVPGYLRATITIEPTTKVNVLSLNGGGGPDGGLSAKLWRQGRRKADAAGRKENPIVLVGYAYDGQELTHGVEITKDAFKTARLGRPPLEGLGALPASVTVASAPWDYHSALRIINEYIEKDVEDKLKLRRNLRLSDKQKLVLPLETRLAFYKNMGHQ